MKHTIAYPFYRVFRIILGSLVLLLGVAGLVLPILQGWLLIALGALLLSKDIPFFARVVRWVKTRFPEVSRTGERLKGAVLARLRLTPKM
jgi:uncharacterized membrane protein YbaN (DUF454 family)